LEIWQEDGARHKRMPQQYKERGSDRAERESDSFEIDGKPFTIEEIAKKCESLSELKSTIVMLKSGSKYIAEYQLIGACLPTLVANASSPEALKELRAFAESQGRYSAGSYLQHIAGRFLELGEVDEGLECCEAAIRDGTLEKPLKILADYDRERAFAFLIDYVHRDLKESEHSGFDIPRRLAVACDVLDQSETAERVFQDFLEHCQELFAQLPDRHGFDELKTLGNVEIDESEQICHILIDRLECPATEFAERLIKTLIELARSNPEKVVPKIVERLGTAKGLSLWRLIDIVLALAHSVPQSLRDYSGAFASLFEREDVFVRLALIQIVEKAFAGCSVPNDLSCAVDDVRRDYSSKIAYRGFKILQISPSQEFNKLIKHGTNFSFQRELSAVCAALGIDLDAMRAHLERRLVATGTTIEEECDDARDMASDFVHPQGWPIIWFVPDSQVKLRELLFHAIDECLRKGRYQESHLHALWAIIQSSDPAYLNYALLPLPDGIVPLVVENEEAWNGTKKATTVSIRDALPDEWLTVFEYRQLSQDSPYYVEYVAQSHVRSALVRPDILSAIEELHSSICDEEIVLFHPGENITWEQLVKAILGAEGAQLDPEMPLDDLVSFKQRHAGFYGFHSIAGFSADLLAKFPITFDGLRVLHQGETVGLLEAWQEGYPDEEYSDEPLSTGVRFRASGEFVRKICLSASKALAVQTVENHFVMEHYSKSPKKQSSAMSIEVWPVTGPDETASDDC